MPGNVRKIDLLLPSEVANYIQNRKRSELDKIEKNCNVVIEITGQSGIPVNSFNLEVKISKGTDGEKTSKEKEMKGKLKKEVKPVRDSTTQHKTARKTPASHAKRKASYKAGEPEHKESSVNNTKDAKKVQPEDPKEKEMKGNEKKAAKPARDLTKQQRAVESTPRKVPYKANKPENIKSLANDKKDEKKVGADDSPEEKLPQKGLLTRIKDAISGD
jgi:hypothetical protein